MVATSCASSVYPILVAQIQKPSVIAKGVAPSLNPGNLYITGNSCSSPGETLSQAQQQLANQSYYTPAPAPPKSTTFTLTLVGA